MTWYQWAAIVYVAIAIGIAWALGVNVLLVGLRETLFGILAWPYVLYRVKTDK